MEQVKNYTKSSFPQGSIIHKVSDAVQARLKKVEEAVEADKPNLSELEVDMSEIFLAMSQVEDFYYTTLKGDIPVEYHEEGFGEVIQQVMKEEGMTEDESIKVYAEVFVSTAFEKFFGI